MASPDDAGSGRTLPFAEKALIARIRRQASTADRIVQGIGDDCAVLRIPARHEILVTTDFSLEGVHFRRKWHPSESVGHRCLTRGLSDIAAMGGNPVAAFLSLALPSDLEQSWVDGFMKGFQSLARKFGVTLAGGDIAQSPNGVLADIMVLGSVPRGKAILRSRARPGDKICVTGSLGESAAVLEQLFAGQKPDPRCVTHHFFPQPRLEAGSLLREKGLASAMIDLSDGLSTDLAHICEESRVGAELWADAIPRAIIGKAAVDQKFALHGGDDYELLFTVSGTKAVPRHLGGVAITEIGEIITGRSMFLVNGKNRSRLNPQGWEHFKK